MKKIIKYIICGFSLFLIHQMHTLASSIFLLEQDPNGLTYKIERTDKTVRLYFMLVKDRVSGELVYCLEPGVALSDEVYQELEEWEYAKLNLTEEQKEYITKVAYFGYGYNNHTDLSYYYAAQLLIWKKIIPINWDIYFTNYLGGEKIELFQEEQQQILNEIEKDNKIPSMSNQTYSWNKVENLIIKDTNEVLIDYKIKDNQNVKVAKNENQLELNIRTNQKETLEFEKEYMGNPLKFYMREDGQNVLKRGSLKNKTFQIFLNPYKTEIEIAKIDEDNNPISNVEFSLIANEVIKNGQGKIIYNKGDLIEKFYTNEAGKIKITELYNGEYCLEETSVPNEYVLKQEKYCFKLSQNHQKESLKITSQKKKQKLILLKKDETEDTFLKGVRFQIVNEQGKIIYDGVTNQEGKIEIEALPLGIYQIIEIETLENYELKKEPLRITVDAEETEKVITITNRRIPNVPNTMENIHMNNTIIYEKERKYL